MTSTRPAPQRARPRARPARPAARRARGGLRHRRLPRPRGQARWPRRPGAARGRGRRRRHPSHRATAVVAFTNGSSQVPADIAAGLRAQGFDLADDES